MGDSLERLRGLLAAVLPDNAFYASRLQAAGVTAENLTSVADYVTRVPVTTKAQLVADQAAHPPYGSNLTYKLESYCRFCQTTGTTGRPLIYLDTAASWDWMLGNWAQIYAAAQIRPGERIYFAFSFGPFLGFWTAFEAAAKLGFLSLPGGGLSSEARLRAMIHHQASVLLCTPTYALHLAETAREKQIDLGQSAVRKIIVAGEPGGSVPEVRARISALWNGAQVIDHYGMTEVGPVACEDPDHPGWQRVLTDSYFAEVLDPQTGGPTRLGEIGELILTSLGRIGTPLLRYRTGDLVKPRWDEKGLILEGGILGRADDMIVVRGVNLYPSAIDGVVRSVPSISEYRVLVSKRGALCEVALEIESEIESAVSQLQGALNEAFALRIPVARVEAGSLPRFELKARRWQN